MATVYPDEGLTQHIHAIAGETWNIHLYTNTYTPVSSSTSSSFIESSDTGLAAQTATVSSYTGGSGFASVSFNPITWTSTGSDGSAHVNGWFALDGSGKVLAAEQLTTPVDMTTAGNTLTLQINTEIVPS